MSAEKPILVVHGATGQQGGSLVRTFLEEKDASPFKLRAVTRDTQASSARELAAQGVELVQADLDDQASLERAYQGAQAVFLVTNFWQPAIMANPEIELEQGKKSVDAALAAGVRHLVYSSLHNVDAISGGKLHVPHFTNKNRVQQYAEKVASENPNFTVSFAYAGFYAQNIISLFSMTKESDGSLSYRLPVSAQTTVPAIDITQFGYVVREIFKQPQRFSGAVVPVAAEYVSFQQILDHAKQHLNAPSAQFHQISDQEAAQAGLNEEVTHMLKWFEQYGYYNGADISVAKELYGQLRGVADFFRSTNWTGPQ